MVPLLILEAIFKACRKEVLVGSKVVMPLGIMTSAGALIPAFAAAGTLVARQISLIFLNPDHW